MSTFSLFIQWVTVCIRKDIISTATLECSLAASEKVKYTLIIQPGSPIPRVLPKRKENFVHTENFT